MPGSLGVSTSLQSWQTLTCTRHTGFFLFILMIIHCWGRMETIIDTALPFRLRLAPKIFSPFADALAWVLWRRGVKWPLHYLDDILFLGRPGTEECKRALGLALATCSQLGYQ